MNFSPTLVKSLKTGKIVVLPTDTLYGLVGQALRPKTVARIYTLKKRNPKKPVIILIGDITELKKFKITLSPKQKEVAKKIWSSRRASSIIFDCSFKKFFYLHRGTKTLAFRLPRQKKFRAFLLKTGPLVAPSANPEGLPPAKNIKEAKKYFGEAVDFYLPGKILEGKPSKIIRLKKNGFLSIIRS